MARKKQEDEDIQENEEDYESEELGPEEIGDDYSEEEVTEDSGEYVKGFNEELLTCDFCGRNIDPDQAVLKEISDEEHTFCSERCATNFKKEHKK